MAEGKFEVYVDRKGEHRFRLRTGNGEHILLGEGYSSRNACENGIASVRRNASHASRYERKATQSGKHYFLLKAENHQVIGQSQAYSSSSGVESGIESVMRNGVNGRIEYLNEPRVPKRPHIDPYRYYPDPLIVSQFRDGKVVEVSDCFVKTTGYSRDAIVGTVVTDHRLWAYPGDAERFRAVLRTDGCIRRREFLGCDVDGKTRAWEISAQVVTELGGHHVVAVLHDKTEVRQLRKAALSSAESERHHLAQELNDGVAQDLAGANYLLQSLEALSELGDADLEKIERLREALAHSVQTLRRMARGLLPFEVRHGGFQAAFDRLIHDVSRVYEVKVQIDGVHLLHDCRLTTKRAICHVVHDAVYNAAKYGQCDRIGVLFAIENSIVRVSIADDGRGMDLDESREAQGLGLRFLHYRAQALGGSVDISSTPGEGTQIKCDLPYERRRRAKASAQWVA